MRELFVLERYYWESSNNRLQQGFVLSITLNKPIPDDVLTEAIRLTGLDYPWIFQNIKVKDAQGPDRIEPIKKRLVTEDLIKHVDNDEPNHILETLRLETTDDNCAWVVLVKENRFTLFLNHTFFDGMSAYNLWSSIIKYANQGVRSTDGLIYDGNGQNILSRHAYEEVEMKLMDKISAKIAPYWIQYVAPSIAKIFPSHLFSIPGFNLQEVLLDKNGNIRQDQKRLKWTIPPTQLKEILAEVRARNLTLTVWICAKLAYQLTKIKSSTKGSTIKLAIPMSMRPFLIEKLGKDPKDIATGNYVSAAYCTLSLDKYGSELWTIANEINKSLQKAKEDPVANINYVKLLDEVDLTKFIKEKYKTTSSPCTLELSNLGMLDPSSPDDEYQLLDAEFQQPMLTSSILCCSSISTRLGGLTVNFSYPIELDKIITPAFEELVNPRN